VAETRIIKKVEYLEFRRIIDRFKDKIKVNSHARFRLNEMQRKVYKDEVLIEILSTERPAFVGVQNNRNYAAFFGKKQGYFRLVFKVTTENIEIITFYITNNIPKV